MIRSERDIPGFIFWLVLTFTIAAFGSAFQLGEWYGQLNKPVLNHLITVLDLSGRVYIC